MRLDNSRRQTIRQSARGEAETVGAGTQHHQTKGCTPMTETVTINLDEVVFDESIYPRAAHDDATVDRYVDALEAGATFPPIILEPETNRQWDGRHRWLSHQRAGRDTITAEYRACPEGVPPKLFAASFSVKHGRRINTDDARTMAREYYESREATQEQVAEYLGVSIGTVNSWVSDLAAHRRDLRAASAWLLREIGWTQQAIADLLGVARTSIVNFFNTEKTDITESLLREAATQIADKLVGYTIDDLVDGILYADEEAAAKSNLERLAAEGNPHATHALALDLPHYRAKYAAWQQLDREEARRLAAAKREQEQLERDIAEAAVRDGRRIKSFLHGFDCAYSMRTHPNRDRVLQELSAAERTRFIQIEGEITWPSNRIV